MPRSKIITGLKEAMERDQRKWNYRVTTEYRIMHDFEGKPE